MPRTGSITTRLSVSSSCSPTFSPRPAGRGLTKGLRRAPGPELRWWTGLASSTRLIRGAATPARRMSVLQEALSNSGELTYHSLRSAPDES
jgi:hypothetical protein